MQLKGFESLENTLTQCLKRLEIEAGTSKLGKFPYDNTEQKIEHARKAVQMALWHIKAAKVDYMFADRHKRYLLTKDKNII
jgi:hypothetical protein